MSRQSNNRRVKPTTSDVSRMGSLVEGMPTAKKRRRDSSAAHCHDVPTAKQQQRHRPTRNSGMPKKQCISTTSRTSEQYSNGASSECSSSVVLIQVPRGFSLAQAACSYGYYLVPPNLWEPSKDAAKDRDAGTFTRPLRFGKRLANSAKCSITQVMVPETEERGEKGAVLRVNVAAKLADSDEEDIKRQVTRMFQTTMDLKPWFNLSAEAEKRGYGRLFRSPTVFEDMVKSITGCNMKFQGTIRMNKLLCEEFGRNGAFPTPEDLEGVQEEDLKEKAKVGYRADRILRLAKSFRDEEIDPVWLEARERTRDEVMKFVKSLHGFGDYAAGNVAMLLGFYEEIPLDSETVRHFKDYHGVTTKNVREVAPRARQQYASFAPYQFLQYWYEMIVWNEKKRGKEVHLWDSSDFSW